MNFLPQAHHTSHQVLSTLIRSVLLQTSTLVLQHRLTEARRTNVTQEDVYVSYKAAEKVGKKWILKLQDAGEKEAAIIVEKILQNGNFFESITDDVPNECFFADSNSSSERGREEAGGNSSHNCDAFTSQHVDVTQNHATADNIRRNKIINDDENQESIDNQNKKIMDFKSDIPLIALSKIGGQGLTDQICSRSTDSPPRQGVHWHPLPSKEKCTSNNNAVNHISNRTQLPADQLMILPHKQLYGNPSNDLSKESSILNCSTISKKDAFIKSQVQLLDDLGCNSHTLWFYDWITIQTASERNKIRMHMQSSIGKKRRRFVDEAEELNEIGHTTTTQNMIESTDDMGRAASGISTLQWTREEIENSFNENEKYSLFKRMIHGFNGEDEDRQKCVGALKFVGTLHLWEQMRVDNWNSTKDEMIPNEDSSHRLIQKNRKKLHTKAKRQRLYPNVEIKKVETISKLSSKVTFTESSGKHFLDLDLGECMMSLRPEKSSEGGVEPRNVVFRSLEISLME